MAEVAERGGRKREVVLYGREGTDANCWIGTWGTRVDPSPCSSSKRGESTHGDKRGGGGPKDSE